MKIDEFEFILQDRIAKIKSLSEQYDMNKTYISFSGGKDSCVLSKLIDLALPNNTIKRVYKDTGIEYYQMRNFVKKMQNQDERFIYLKPDKNIKKTLSEVGYPFKSKQHSHNFQIYRNNINLFEEWKNKFIKADIKNKIKNGTYTQEDIELINNIPRGIKAPIKYYFGIRVGGQKPYFTQCFSVPDKLKIQFTPEYAKKYNWSSKCCAEFKHGLLEEYAIGEGYKYTFTGMRKQEGGSRTKLNCITKSQKETLHFNPLAIVSEEWEDEFIKRYNVELCELYSSPYNFKRTGCLFCPFSMTLKQDLENIKMVDKKLYKQAYLIWKPVFDEYERLNYRLKKKSKYKQVSIFDL